MTFEEGFMAQSLIARWTQEGKLFTAWDITRHLRSIGMKSIKHHELRLLVHDAFTDNLMQNYNRTLSVVRPDGTQALIYHPQTACPCAYTP